MNKKALLKVEEHLRQELNVLNAAIRRNKYEIKRLVETQETLKRSRPVYWELIGSLMGVKK